MLVSNRMTKDPITVTPDDFLINAKEKMEGGKFHRLPVVSEGRLVGIITDRDMRAHVGYLAKTKVNGAMTEKALTVRPSATLEEAAQLLLRSAVCLSSTTVISSASLRRATLCRPSLTPWAHRNRRARGSILY